MAENTPGSITECGVTLKLVKCVGLDVTLRRGTSISILSWIWLLLRRIAKPVTVPRQDTSLLQ